MGHRDGAHVTLRCVEGLRSLRRPRALRVVERVFAAEKSRKGFRLVHYAVQSNHMHLVCEADDPLALSRGVQRVACRVARRVNELWKRNGRLFADRFHSVVFSTPRQARHVLAYVLLNAQKDWAKLGIERDGIDLASSGELFDGWEDAEPRGPPPRFAVEEDCPVTKPGSWLLSQGWRRHGLLRRDERAPQEPLEAACTVVSCAS